MASVFDVEVSLKPKPRPKRAADDVGSEAVKSKAPKRVPSAAHPCHSVLPVRRS